MSVNIKYKNNSIAELTDTGTKTLKTAGKYCEADIVVENTKDGGATITDGIVVNEWGAGYVRDRAPKSITLHTNGVIGQWQFAVRDESEFGFYAYVTEFDHVSHAPLLYIGESAFRKCQWVTKEIVEELFSTVKTCNGNIFAECKGIVGDITLPELEDINQYGNPQPLNYYNYNGGIFNDCTKITSINCPKLKRVIRRFALGCTALKSASLPKCQSLATQNNGLGSFGNCTALETIQLGSVGTSCKVYSGYDFQGCTQSTLTITLYCVGELVEANLAFLRNGATNATIIIKASEDTTYNGTEYAAGDTIVTSTVETGGTS